MTQCTGPIKGYQSKKDRSFTNDKKEAYRDLPMTIRCNQCIGCRLDRTFQWSIRSVNEASMHEQNCFVTLTYDDDNLPFNGNLIRDEMPKFVRALRQKGYKFRVFYCGEYGTINKRPHYHILIFGFCPDDLVLEKVVDENKLYSSKMLSDLWGKGVVYLYDNITPSSAAYVAGYILDKVLGKAAPDHYQNFDPESGEIFNLLPEFSGQSLKPGIGQPWIKKFLHDTYKDDYVVFNGNAVKPPKFYDRQLEKLDPELFKKVRAKRARANFKPLYIPDLRPLASQYYGTSRQMLCADIIAQSKAKMREGQ